MKQCVCQGSGEKLKSSGEAREREKFISSVAEVRIEVVGVSSERRIGR